MEIYQDGFHEENLCQEISGQAGDQPPNDSFESFYGSTELLSEKVCHAEELCIVLHYLTSRIASKGNRRNVNQR